MIDPCSFKPQGLLPLADALERLLAGLEPVAGTETVSLTEAIGRVAAGPVYAPMDLPCDDSAAMDGYAFNSDGISPGSPFSLTLAGASWAGRPFRGRLQPGRTVRIFTGAVVPAEADSVVMQEQVTLENDRVCFPADVAFGQNIRKAGEDIRQGDLLCGGGTLVSAYDAALLASAGIGCLRVRRKVRAAFFATGDELTPVGRPLASGGIYDSNRYLLAGFLKRPYLEITDGGILADDKERLRSALADASESHDVIITTGGASVGDADYIKDILAESGQINFWKLALKPGKPLAVGKLGDCHMFGLPGNPVSVIITFRQLIAPGLERLAGAPRRQPLRIGAVCAAPLKKSPGRTEFQRGILNRTVSGDFQVVPAGPQGSHMLGSMSRANCLIVLPAECGDVEAGQQVTVEPLTLLL